MFINKILSIILIYISLSLCSCSNIVNFTLPDGNIISGIRSNDGMFVSYYGIPYAAPPINELRFQIPLPPMPLPKYFNATNSNVTSCYQVSPFPIFSKQSEDCLTLDIHVPTSNSMNGYDVIVWLYGGSLIFGSTHSYPDITNLARTDKIVVVVNYRLNYFGFLAHQYLSENHDLRRVSGNLGIADQQMALKFVQRYIRSFQGNDRSITLLGQSSGGTSIFAHYGAPESNNLFQAAISLSGSPNNTMNLSTAQSQNQAAFDTYCPHATLNGKEWVKCVLKLSPDEIIKSVPSDWSFAPNTPLNPHANWPGLSIVDGVTVTHAFSDALKIPIVDVPLVIQSLGQETETFDDTPSNWTEEQLAKWINNTKVFVNTGTQDYVLEIYQNDAPSKAYYTINGDVGVLCANRQIAMEAKLSKNFTSPIYVNFISVTPEKPIPFIGRNLQYAFHLWDYIALVQGWDFFNVITGHLVPSYTPTTRDNNVSDSLLQIVNDIVKDHSTAKLSKIDACDSPPCINVLGAVNDDVKWSVNVPHDYCSFYEKIKVVQPEYWWVN